MRKIFLSLAMALAAFTTAQADKAWPYPITITQSDGTAITVRMHGDEHFFWYTDMDGNILERRGNDFTPVATTPEAYLAQAKAAQAKAARREPIAASASLFPHTGSPKAVVVLAEFQDRKFTVANPKVNFDQYLNKEGVTTLTDYGHGEHLNYGSVRQYFIDQSDGKFSPQFDVYGPITLPHPMAYYGGSDDNGRDERYLQLLQDACAAVVDSVDFAQYDQDGDGKIDLVYVVYAGYGQSSGAETYTMWPKRFPASTITATYDGKGINQGGISNELMGYEGAFGYTSETVKTFETATKYINGIGLFVHEFSHCLGLPDFYPTNTSSYYDNQGMEDWSVMDNGEYSSMGRCPVAYTAWEREAMGWDNIPTITTAGQYRLDGQVAGGTNAVKVANPANSNEYFVLQHYEDRRWNQRVARSGTYNPDTKGLLIYHVNYNSSFNLYSNSVNNTIGAPRMTVVPADGRLVSSYRTGGTNPEVSMLDYAKQANGDIFRVDDTHADSTFTQTGGLPNAAWRTAAAATPIYNINYKEGFVYFDFLERTATTGIGHTVGRSTATDERIYSLDGRYMGTQVSTLPHGIYIRGGKKFVK